MAPDTWERIKDLFERAREAPASERARVLAEEQDEAVRSGAEQLLSDDPEEAIIDRPAMPAGLVDRLAGLAQSAFLQPGELLGSRFVIEKRLGSGGMGDIYAARDQELRERVAVKTIRNDIIGNPATASRFRREISLARRVSHRNVCRVYDLFREKRSSTQEPVDFLTMELIEGETLADWIRRDAPIPFADALPILLQICDGLAAAHEAGIVHRDFKGSNVLLSEVDGAAAPRRAAVADFGLARSVSPSDASNSSTQAGAGTPAYMSPEQMEGKPVGPATDLYALGIVMYEMATGAQPHPGDSPLQIAVRRVKEAPQAPHLVNPDIDPRWEAAILHCLAFSPEDRPASAAELGALLQGEAVSSKTRKQSPPVKNEAPPLKRPPWLLAGGVAAFAVVALIAWLSLGRAPAHNEEALRWYRRGTDAVMDGAYSTARASFEEALKREPEFGVARARLADTYYELDMPDETRREIALAKSTNPAESLLIEAIRRSVERNVAETRRLADQLVNKSNNVESLLDRARLLERLDLIDEATAAYGQVLGRDATHAGALLRQARLWIVKGSKRTEAARALDLAESTYRKAGSLEGQASVFLARAALQEENLPVAEEHARQAEVLARQSGSDTLRVRAKLAQARYASRRGDAATGAKLASEAVAVAKETGQAALGAEGLADLAGLAYFKQDYKLAAEQYRQALDVAEASAAPRQVALIRRRLGDTLMRIERVPESIRLLEQALSFFQANGFVLDALQCRQMLGDADMVNGDFERALAKLKAVHEESKRTPGAEALTLRVAGSVAQIYWSRGEYPIALDIMRERMQAYERLGNRARVQSIRLMAAAAMRKLGRYDEAEEALRINLKEGVNPAVREDAEVQIAVLLRYRGNHAGAIDALSRLLEKDIGKGPDSEVRRQLCATNAEARRIAEARRFCDPLMSITHPGSNVMSALLPAAVEIKLAAKQFDEAHKLSVRLREWGESHNDPEVRLLSHLLIAASVSQDGARPVPQEFLSAWRKEREALEARWGKDNVSGLIRQPAFHLHAKVVGGF